MKKTKKKARKSRSKVKGVRVKAHPGTSAPSKPRPNLVGDSYQADERDLRKAKRLCKKHGCSKAALVRYGTKLAILAFEAKAAGKKTLTIPLVV